MFPLIPLIIGLPLVGFWIWMLVDLANNDYLSNNEKTYWFIIIMIFNAVGSFWYYLVEYRPRHL